MPAGIEAKMSPNFASIVDISDATLPVSTPPETHASLVSLTPAKRHRLFDSLPELL
jgi:hypothetical protein